MWSRWPTAGPTARFDSREEFDELVSRLVESGAVLDPGMIYWDIRPSQKFPTLEFRVADVMLTVDDAVLVAALTRALVATSLQGTDPPRDPRPELLRASNWMAARNGLSGDLMDPFKGGAHPAREMVDRLLRYTRPSLEAAGDRTEVERLCQRAFTEGTGAERQRAAFAANNGSFRAVLDLATVPPAP